MTSVLLDSIIEGDRARREYRNLDKLADSIRELGVLSPVTLTPDLTLVCGGRRVRAARMAGLDRIPAVIVTRMEDALLRLKAERDENTCREEMTPEEMVDLGRQIEAMERPKAAERQSGGVQILGSEGGQTRDKVGEALGVSGATYQRAKHVVDVARGDKPAEPQVQEAAKEALDAMNAGNETITGAYAKVRGATKPKEPTNLAMPQPPKYGPRRRHLQVLDAMEASLSGLALVADDIQALDNTITQEEAARLMGDLSKHIRSLNRVKQLLKERTE